MKKKNLFFPLGGFVAEWIGGDREELPEHISNDNNKDLEIKAMKMI